VIAHIRRWLWRLRGFFILAPAARSLASVCLVVFLAQQTAAKVEFVNIYGYSLSYAQALTRCFSLNWPLLSQGFLWQPATYMFLHGSWMHLLLNMFTVLFFGSGLEMEVGGRQFWRIFLTGGILGGLGWLAVTAALPHLPALHGWFGGAGAGRTLETASCIGASGGVFALIGAYAVLFPQREVCLLLFFVFPVRMKGRSLAWFLGLMTVAEAIFMRSQIAYAAHLSGGLAGYLYGRWLEREGV